MFFVVLFCCFVLCGGGGLGFFCLFPKGWDRENDRIILFAGVMLILWLESLAGYQQSG